MSCKCMKLISRSAIESANSAKAGSIASSGRAAAPSTFAWTLPVSRKDVRELGRKGVAGREEVVSLRAIARLVLFRTNALGVR